MQGSVAGYGALPIPTSKKLITLIGDYRVARAAFEEAVTRRPGRILTLRQKTRVLADSRRRD
jgi:hypothetical protein